MVLRQLEKQLPATKDDVHQVKHLWGERGRERERERERERGGCLLPRLGPTFFTCRIAFLFYATRNCGDAGGGLTAPNDGDGVPRRWWCCLVFVVLLVVVVVVN